MIAMAARRKPIRTNRLLRSIGPARLGASAGLRWAAARLPASGDRAQRKEQATLKTAEDVTRTLGEMKGAVMKLGQVLSLMTGVVPEEMTGSLETLHASAPPMDYSLVRQVFREEFRREPKQIFASFDEVPFAAASIGQVHRARLKSGELVAVKVQYPGVREAIRADLANVGMLLGLAGMFAPGMNVGTIVKDLKEGIIAELDYCREATYQQRFHELYRGHAFVRVPRVYPTLSSGRVLVQELLEGRRFAEARSLAQDEKNRISEILFRFAFGNFYRHGLFNGDPHPGNYILMDDGYVGFVDYGCVTEFDPETIASFARVIDALFAGDLERWRAMTEAVGILRPGAPYTTQQLYDHMHWFWKPVLSERVTFTRDLATEMVRRNAQVTGEGGAINKCLDIPEGMVFLTRINFGLAGVLAGLNAEGPWRSIIAEYVHGGPPSTDLGRLSAATSRGPAI